MFTEKDIRQIEERGSSVQTVKGQIEQFRKGFPINIPVKIERIVFYFYQSDNMLRRKKRRYFSCRRRDSAKFEFTLPGKKSRSIDFGSGKQRRPAKVSGKGHPIYG